MDHKKEVIGAAIRGLIEGGMEPEAAKGFYDLLILMYESGYNEAIRNVRWKH